MYVRYYSLQPRYLELAIHSANSSHPVASRLHLTTPCMISTTWLDFELPESELRRCDWLVSLVMTQFDILVSAGS